MTKCNKSILFVKVQGSQKGHIIFEPGCLGKSKMTMITSLWICCFFSDPLGSTYLVVRLIDEVRLEKNTVSLLKYFCHCHYFQCMGVLK